MQQKLATVFKVVFRYNESFIKSVPKQLNSLAPQRSALYFFSISHNFVTFEDTETVSCLKVHQAEWHRGTVVVQNLCNSRYTFLEDFVLQLEETKVQSVS